MFSTGLIIFREILEISIILSVIMAATKAVPSRNRWVWLGIAGGVMGSALVALFADVISQSMEGMGQEVFNAAILGVAVVMIGWTVVWMRKHGKELANRIRHIGHAVTEGDMPLYSVAVVVSLSMWREGAEIVLFMTSILSTSKESLPAITLGGAVGFIAAAILGVMLYLGLLKLHAKHLFSVTGALLILLACGMAAQAAGYLVAADMLPVIVPQLWDSSWLLSESSVMGRVLHSMIGYVDRPSGIQLVVYISTFVAIRLLMELTREDGVHLRRLRPVVGIWVAVAAAVVVGMHPQRAQAAFNIYSPHVEEGMFEVEYKGRYDFDRRANEDGYREHKVGLGYGLTSWWKTELVGEMKQNPNDALRFEASEWENIFQFTQPGEYWADVGLQLDYEFAYGSTDPDKVEVILLLEKETGRFVHIANLKWEKEVGPDAGAKPEGVLAWGTRYLLLPYFNPGVEIHSDFGELAHTGSFSEQKHRIGPAAYGNIGHGFSYEAAYLAGVSRAAEDHSVKLILEYEFPL